MQHIVIQTPYFTESRLCQESSPAMLVLTTYLTLALRAPVKYSTCFCELRSCQEPSHALVISTPYLGLRATVKYTRHTFVNAFMPEIVSRPSSYCAILKATRPSEIHKTNFRLSMMWVVARRLITLIHPHPWPELPNPPPSSDPLCNSGHNSGSMATKWAAPFRLYATKSSQRPH